MAMLNRRRRRKPKDRRDVFGPSGLSGGGEIVAWRMAGAAGLTRGGRQQMIPPMPYPAVKCFWVERTGKWRATVYGKGGAPEVSTDHDSEEAARGTDWDCLSPLLMLPDGRLVQSNEVPPGAMYAAGDDYRKGPDGIALVAVCPDKTHWRIDGRCTNCAKPDDNEHYCWLRTGDARTAMITVSRGCVGGGSIQTSQYHGKLENGAFTEG